MKIFASKNNNKGVILISAYIIIVILLILGSSYILRSVSEKRIADRSRDSVQALSIAEAGIDKVTADLWTTFNTTYPNPTMTNFVWFDNLLGANPPYTPPSNTSFGTGRYTVQVVSVTTPTGLEGRDVTIRSQSTVNDTQRSVEAVIRYNLAPFGVFNYSYFINNFGWFYGGGITSNGDVRSNGNFAFQGNPMVNGDIYASVNPDLGAAGTITGDSRNQTASQYQSGASTRARPTNPTDLSNPNDTIFDPGYKGTSSRYPQQQLLNMPYLGDLSTYESLAISQGGTIKQGGNTLVNGVYSGNGPDGIAGTPDDGCVVLIGTDTNPIIINGPVVVTNDVVIKGKVQGQGTIYSGRNTHVVGDVTYKNPPSWPKPDSNPNQTNTTNATKDFLGLVSKGNLIVGDYTRNDWQTNVTTYLKPPFTQAYKVDAADSSIGYVQYYNNGQPYFNGDYTVNDSGSKDNGTGGSANRKFYESSLSDSYIHSISDASSSIRQVDAVTYTNHAVAGKMGAFTINGSMISRDEATVYSGSIDMNYDVRAYGSGTQSLNIFLPRELAPAQTISWKE